MSDSPRVDAAIGPPRTYEVTEFVALAATYADLLGVARQLEWELIEKTNSLSEGNTFQLAQRTADSLDAERYRFLRNGAAFEECGPSVCSGCSDQFEYLWGAEVDEEVDEAMARWKAAGSPVSKETA